MPQNKATLRNVLRSALANKTRADDLIDGIADASLIDDCAITGAHILDGTVLVADIGPNAVDTAELVDCAVDGCKLADCVVDTCKLATNAVLAVNITAANVTSAKLELGLSHFDAVVNLTICQIDTLAACPVSLVTGVACSVIIVDKIIIRNIFACFALVGTCCAVLNVQYDNCCTALTGSFSNAFIQGGATAYASIDGAIASIPVGEVGADVELTADSDITIACCAMATFEVRTYYHVVPATIT